MRSTGGDGTAPKAIAATLLGVALAVLAFLNTPGINGTWYWKWRWDPIEPQWFIPPMLAAYLLHLYGQFLWQRYRRAAVPLILLAACAFSMQIIGRALQEVPPSLRPMTFLVRNPLSTSYYDDARRLLYEPDRPAIGEWLATYPKQLPEMRPHSKYKPPGLVLLFVALINLVGDEHHRAATVGAFIIAALAAAAVPACYAMLRRLLRNREAAFAGACYMALCPSLIVFFPSLDQTYPLLTCGIVTSWIIALRRHSIRAALACGLLVAFAFFLSYVFVVIGAALAGLALLRLKRQGIRWIVAACSIVFATIVLFYTILYLATRFDPIGTYRAIVALHNIGVAELHRPAYPRHVPFDLAEFAMGFGWIGVLLAGFYLVRRGEPRRPRRIAWLAVAQLGIVAAMGLWPAETARIWLPLMPITLIPVALELRDWDWRWRAAALTSLWLVTTILWQNMRFVA